ncbi:protein TEX261-like [Anneissia japonica]|uniref:protein TEX261-like n=1 Tax=Anneissia japonica TaxID=1529436 RepID=UPI001425A791|nr:protein TEX261-like [Anneissia japonica]
MWFLFILSWVATLVQVCFVTLALAAGLYYLAELVEEYTVMAKKVIKWLIISTVCVYIGLILFEDMPKSLTLTGFASTCFYSLLLSNFPYIEVMSPVFIISCIMLFANHYIAFQHFTEEWYPFAEVLAYFTICLWLVPFAFFVSLSANDNVLPTTATTVGRGQSGGQDVVSSYFNKKSKRNGLLAVFDFCKETFIPQRDKRF